MASAPPPHIALLPTPGMGHLIPFFELAKNLHLRHGISSTLILPTDGPLSAAQTAFLSDLPSNIDYLLLPPVNFDDLPTDVKGETRISLTITRSLPSIHNAVRTLNETVTLSALIVDLFATDGFEAASKLNIPAYVFFSSTAMTLSLFLHLPELDQTVSSEYWQLTEKLRIPGCSIPVHGKDLVDQAQDRKNEAYKWLLRHANAFRLADGIILNSFKELEPGPIEFLQGKKPTLYPIGPLVRMSSPKPDSDPCMEWLDCHPSESVMYVSFGSGGTLSRDQITELAFGLETSEQRFVWVLRSPSDASNAVGNSEDPSVYLPEGFLQRTRGRGLVVPMWAPQARILAHGSVGGFLTHCGFNSILESVVNGVPMIGWPLCAEQKMNAVMLHEDLKVALRPVVGENGLVGRVEISNVVKCLMEEEQGKGIRSRVGELKNAAGKSLGENGSSTKTMAELAAKWIIG